MILAFDSYYFDDRARTVCLAFEHWADAQPAAVFSEITENIAEYEPGAFYKRELPCILNLMKKLSHLPVDMILVDGFVVLDDEQKPGLGAHLYHALDKKFPVIGIAKTDFISLHQHKREVLRGQSNKPLFITAIGMDINEAAQCIKNMYGEHRLPHLLKQLDILTKTSSEEENKTTQAVNLFNKYASQYQDKFMDVQMYKPTLDLFCQHLSTENAAILELACGPGNITRYLLDQKPKLNILATDLAPNMLELAKKNNPSINCLLLDSRQIHTLSQKFDGIMIGFCLPYLSKEDTIQLIKHTADRLNPNGLMYISTMEDKYKNSGWRRGSQGDEIYMYYHQEDYLAEALTANGFSIISTTRIPYPQNDGINTTDLILVAKKTN